MGSVPLSARTSGASGDDAGMLIVVMRRHHLESVVRIESGIAPAPWSKATFESCLKAGYDCLVVMRETRVVAYAVMSMAVDEAHLLNVGVAPRFQGAGVGSGLLAASIAAARQAGASGIFLEVRLSNSGAQRLYRRLGFEQVGYRKRYYPDSPGYEDALVMKKVLSPQHPGFGS